ncbi:MAG: hypothetical protein AAF645_28065, partial [Myxococcota bacterium]
MLAVVRLALDRDAQGLPLIGDKGAGFEWLGRTRVYFERRVDFKSRVEIDRLWRAPATTGLLRALRFRGSGFWHAGFVNAHLACGTARLERPTNVREGAGSTERKLKGNDVGAPGIERRGFKDLNAVVADLGHVERRARTVCVDAHYLAVVDIDQRERVEGHGDGKLGANGAAARRVVGIIDEAVAVMIAEVLGEDEEVTQRLRVLAGPITSATLTTTRTTEVLVRRAQVRVAARRRRRIEQDAGIEERTFTRTGELDTGPLILYYQSSRAGLTGFG